MTIYPELQDFFYNTDHGRDILRCIQCGTCSGSCPYSDQMDYAPRGLFALIRDNEMSVALTSNTLWFCSSCYQCMERCPQEIPVTDIVYTLKQMAMKMKKVPPGLKMPDLYASFAYNLLHFGRVTEPMIMAKYSLKHPLDALRSIPLAVKLMIRKRMEIKPQMTKNRNSIRDFLKQKPPTQKESEEQGL
jgi:heterodisulfide reductase subunit C2